MFYLQHPQWRCNNDDDSGAGGVVGDNGFIVQIYIMLCLSMPAGGVSRRALPLVTVLSPCLPAGSARLFRERSEHPSFLSTSPLHSSRYCNPFYGGIVIWRFLVNCFLPHRAIAREVRWYYYYDRYHPCIPLVIAIPTVVLKRNNSQDDLEELNDKILFLMLGLSLNR